MENYKLLTPAGEIPVRRVSVEDFQNLKVGDTIYWLGHNTWGNPVRRYWEVTVKEVSLGTGMMYGDFQLYEGGGKRPNHYDHMSQSLHNFLASAMILIDKEELLEKVLKDVFNG